MQRVRLLGTVALMAMPLFFGSVRVSSAAAADSLGWRTYARPYLFLTGVSGSVTADALTYPINSDFSDLLDNVRPSAFVSLTAERGSWGGYIDMQYINLAGEATNSSGTSLELRNFVAEIDLSYRPVRSSTLKFLVGMRVYSVEQKLKIRDLDPVEASTTVFDPILGAEGSWNLSDQWGFEIRGDIGGFGVSSEFTNQLAAIFTWRMSPTLRLPFGYRVLGYQINADDIWMNIGMGGMVLGLDIDF